MDSAPPKVPPRATPLAPVHRAPVVPGPVSLSRPRPERSRTVNIYTVSPVVSSSREVVTVQPTPLKKCTLPDMVPLAAAACRLEPRRTPSFMCARCGRCRCGACAGGEREFPGRGRCLTVIDWLSCVCVVRAVGYHCCSTATDSGSRRVDRPCSCGDGCGPGAALRHVTMAGGSLLLPCLCCYWPMRCCLKTSEACFSRCAPSAVGCRCSGPNTSFT